MAGPAYEDLDIAQPRVASTFQERVGHVGLLRVCIEQLASSWCPEEKVPYMWCETQLQGCGSRSRSFCFRHNAKQCQVHAPKCLGTASFSFETMQSQSASGCRTHCGGRHCEHDTCREEDHLRRNRQFGSVGSFSSIRRGIRGARLRRK